ncbi:hypothetical protein O181_059464 [Austropuccinia psidii MF-1]|uniref:Uncharacterized protein n=1 Tax=Austropuccinia psidii MF-1 TaxID=1389203 RepID=A0A9Q3EEB7_9BASI|nr:hypothetical protein [Austropuccinia psidii MF-1]
MQAEEFKASEEFTSCLKKFIKEVGHNPIMAPPQSPQKMRILDLWVLNHYHDLLFDVGKVDFLMVLGPLNGPRPLGERLVPWTPWNPSIFGPRGPPTAPTAHSWQKLGHQNHEKTPKGHKWP